MKRASYSCNFLCVVLAATYLKYRRYRLSCLPFVWHFFSLWHTHTGECLECSFRLTRGGTYLRGVIGAARWAHIPEVQVQIPSRAMGTFFPHTVSSIFRLSLIHTHTHTHTHTSFSDTLRPIQRRSLQMLDVAVPQIGGGVLHAWFVSLWSWWVSILSVCFDWCEAALSSWCNRKHGGRVSQRYRFESRGGEWALFSLIPSALYFVFSNTPTHM